MAFNNIASAFGGGSAANAGTTAAGIEQTYNQRGIDAILAELAQTKGNMGPFIAPGAGATANLVQGSTAAGLDQRIAEILNTDTFGALNEERTRAVEGQLSSAGLTRSGTGAQEIARVPTELALAIEEALTGRNANLAGNAQDAALGLGTISAQSGNNIARLNNESGVAGSSGVVTDAQTSAAGGQNALNTAATIGRIFFGGDDVAGTVKDGLSGLFGSGAIPAADTFGTGVVAGNGYGGGGSGALASGENFTGGLNAGDTGSWFENIPNPFDGAGDYISNLFGGGSSAASTATAAGNGFGGGMGAGANAVGANPSALASFVGPAVALAAIKFGWDRHVARGAIGDANAALNLAQLSEGKPQPGAVPKAAIQAEYDKFLSPQNVQSVRNARQQQNQLFERALSEGMIPFKDAFSGETFYGFGGLGDNVGSGAIDYVWNPRTQEFGVLDGNNPFQSRAQQAQNAKDLSREQTLKHGGSDPNGPSVFRDRDGVAIQGLDENIFGGRR